jgi:predicted dinucleotide-binding enzyme
MSTPLLVAVDDDPDLLRDVERELRNRYEPDYRVCCLPSTDEALATLEALAAAGAENLRGKVLIDVGNAVEASPGGPALRWVSTDSLAEQIQRAYPEAKEQVKRLLQAFGWERERIIDLGDITGARAMEMYLPLWLRLAAPQGRWYLNIHVV